MPPIVWLLLLITLTEGCLYTIEVNRRLASSTLLSVEFNVSLLCHSLRIKSITYHKSTAANITVYFDGYILETLQLPSSNESSITYTSSDRVLVIKNTRNHHIRVILTHGQWIVIKQLILDVNCNIDKPKTVEDSSSHINDPDCCHPVTFNKGQKPSSTTNSDSLVGLYATLGIVTGVVLAGVLIYCLMCSQRKPNAVNVCHV